MVEQKKKNYKLERKKDLTMVVVMMVRGPENKESMPIIFTTSQSMAYNITQYLIQQELSRAKDRTLVTRFKHRVPLSLHRLWVDLISKCCHYFLHLKQTARNSNLKMLIKNKMALLHT